MKTPYTPLATKATSINIFSFNTPSMRAFHITWMTFFLCFFGWFGVAPLMPAIKEDMGFTKTQMLYTSLASVAITGIIRLLIGWLCDKIGPRLTYTYLLVIGSIPVMLIGLSDSYVSFLIFRLAIGVIGASFVITQYHTSVMFESNVVGRANAMVAGWGNLGAFGSHLIMPIIFAFFTGVLALDSAHAWRYALVVPGVILLIMAFVYYKFTQDTPEGNVLELRKNNPTYAAKNPEVKGSFAMACKDYRTWLLFLVYGACFGIEITFDNNLTLYFMEEYKLGMKETGFIVAGFALMNIFARALGGIFADMVGQKYGTYGKVVLLAVFLAFEGFGIILFSQAETLSMSIVFLISLALFIKMSNGVTYAIVPFVNKQALGSVSGIVGAGGNVGAIAATLTLISFGFREAFSWIGIGVCLTAVATLFMRFKQSPLYVHKSDTNEGEKAKAA